MVVVKCLIHGCKYQTLDLSGDVVSSLINFHKLEHQQDSGLSNNGVIPNALQLIRPRVDRGISQETWLAFIRRWEAFKISSNISNQNASIQLFHCAQDKLGDLMSASDPRLMAKSESYFAKLMESIAVIKIAIGVRRAELMNLHQDHDEPFRMFANRVRSKAETCNFTTVSECDCGKSNVTS